MDSANKSLNGVKESAFKAYQALIVGDPGILSLLKYEFLNALSYCPGALGLFLRSRLYPRLLGRVGKGVVFGYGVSFRHPNKVYIGDSVVVDDHCLIDAKGDDNKGILIGSGSFIGRNTILSCKNGTIEIAENVNIGFNCEIFSSSYVSVGQDSILAAYTYLVGGESYRLELTEIPIAKQPIFSQERQLTVGAGCWLGTRSTMLNGAQLSDGSVLAAHSVLNSVTEKNSIYGGQPAKLIRQRPNKDETC